MATPDLAPDEVYLAVMASSINFNTVWSSIFEPLPTFGFLDRMGRQNEWGKRHALDDHVVGSDASGVVLRVGSAVRNWKPGDRVTVHCNYVDDQDPSAHNDSMLASNQLIWGFETNFGGLADLCVVKANQLMPKPSHLAWEEAAVNALCSSTSLSDARERERRPDEAGRQRADLGRERAASVATPSSTSSTVAAPRSASSPRPSGPSCSTAWAVDAVIDRRAENYQFWSDEYTQDESEWRRFGKKIRELNNGEDVDIVFEHPGRSTMGASVFASSAAGPS